MKGPRSRTVLGWGQVGEEPVALRDNGIILGSWGTLSREAERLLSDRPRALVFTLHFSSHKSRGPGGWQRWDQASGVWELTNFFFF